MRRFERQYASVHQTLLCLLFPFTLSPADYDQRLYWKCVNPNICRIHPYG